MKVAVVGAGMGGLYSAWRLVKSGRYEVALYEGSERIGGRLLTWFPNAEDETIRGELGGMRFIPEQHRMVAQLVRDLELRPVKFPATTQFSYLRGTRLEYGNTAPDAAPNTPPYQLRGLERGSTPTGLLQYVINYIARENGVSDVSALTRQQWDEIKPRMMWKGQRLSNLGFWNVMLDIVSDEGYTYITDGLGYYSLTSNWNAAEAMQFIATDFASDDYYTLAEGYSALATKMADELTGHIEVHRKVIAVEQVGVQWRLTFDDGNATVADRVVMGVPGRAMEMIEFPADVRRKLADLQTALLRVPAFKLFLLYKENWWTYGQGRFTTTLPIRQTYNFNVYPSDDHLMLMASYDDLTTVPYWHGLTTPDAERLFAGGRPALFHPHRFSGLLAQSEATDKPVGFKEAPAGMVARAQAQLEEAVGRPLPLPYASAYMDWSQDPYGGGWSFWAPGTNVPRVMAEVRNLADNLFVVGDSFSGIQGWVEGALTYTERLLQEQFGLPAYLPGYYLGH